MNGKCTYTQCCLIFDKFLRTSSKARNEPYVAANKFEYWDKNLTRMLEIMTCYGADIMIGHSKKRYTQVSEAFKDIEHWAFATKKIERKHVPTIFLCKTTNVLYQTKLPIPKKKTVP